MVGRTLDWKEELGRWLKPFLDRLGHKARRQMCPLYAHRLVGGSAAALVIDDTAICSIRWVSLRSMLRR